MRVAQKFVMLALAGKESAKLRFPKKICVPFISLNYCIFQGQQIIYAANTTGYVMTQGAHGVPVAIPMQVGESMVPVKASHAQVAQPPMVLVPVSGGVGGQSAMVHVAPTTAIPETVSVPQEAVKPPSYV